MGVKIPIDKKQFKIIKDGSKTRVEINHAGRMAGLDVSTRLKKKNSKKISVKRKGQLT